MKTGLFKKILILLGLLYFLGIAHATTVKEFNLNNGLKLLISEDHKAPIATFQIWYRVGSRDEPGGKSGISHLLEHMMFKGSKNYGPKVFSRLIQRNGGVDNAFTTKDYTMYYETLPSDRIELALKLEADRMKGLLLRNEDVEYERNVVMEERRLRYEDDPQSLVYEEVVATAFKVHPYHNPVIGWMSEIASITREDLWRHYRSYYCPQNAFIVVAGDVKAEDILRMVKEHFSDVPECPERRPISSVEPQQRGEKRVYVKKEAKLPYVLIAYHVPSFPDPDSAALDVLSSVLSGKSGRLYKDIVRDRKLAISAFASYSGLQIDPFLFFLGGTATAGTDGATLEKALLEVVEEIKRKPPEQKEVQKAKNQIEATFIMGQDSIFFQAELIGMFEVLGDWRLKDKYLQQLNKVTPEDVSAVARKYLTQENRTVGILIPIDRDNAREINH
jgi:zinc protease